MNGICVVCVCLRAGDSTRERGYFVSTRKKGAWTTRLTVILCSPVRRGSQVSPVMMRVTRTLDSYVIRQRARLDGRLRIRGVFFFFFLGGRLLFVRRRWPCALDGFPFTTRGARFATASGSVSKDTNASVSSARWFPPAQDRGVDGILALIFALWQALGLKMFLVLFSWTHKSLPLCGYRLQFLPILRYPLVVSYVVRHPTEESEITSASSRSRSARRRP